MSLPLFSAIGSADQHNNDLIIPISFFASVKDNDAFDQGSWTWSNVVTVFMKMSAYPYVEKSDAPLYSPTIYQGSRAKKNATTSALLVVDADRGLKFNTAVERLRADAIEAIVHTSGSNDGGDKFRIIVPLSHPVSTEDQERAVRAFCRYLDPAWDPDRGKLNPVSLFYIPGSYERVFNEQTQSFDAVVNDFQHIDGDVLSAAEWIGACPEPEPPAAIKATWTTVANAELSRSVEWKIEDCGAVEKYRSLGKGEHHAGLYGMSKGIAMSAYSAGYDLQADELADFAWDQQAAVLGRHPTTSYHRWQVDRMAAEAIADAPSRVPDPFFARVYKKPWNLKGVVSPAQMAAELRADPPPEWGTPPEAKPEPQPVRSRFRSRTDSKDLPPPLWLVDNLLQADSDNVIYAESQKLKTFIALDIAMSLVTGRAALGMFPIQNKAIVFYFAGEGRHSLDKERLTAWEIANGYEPYSLTDVWTSDSATMANKNDLDAMVADIDDILGDRKGKQPVFFIIDTLSRALNEGDEDKSNVAVRYLNSVKYIRDRVGGTSLTIAHTGKDKTKGIRGSSGFFGGFDTVLFVDNCVRDEDTKTHTLDMFVGKQRDAEDGQRYYFQSERIVTPTGSSLVLHPLTEEDGKNVIKNARPIESGDVAEAIKQINPKDGVTTKRAIAKILAAKTGLSVDGVEKALDRHKDRFKMFSTPEGKWALPSWTNGHDESMEDQIAELKRDQATMFR